MRVRDDRPLPRNWGEDFDVEAPDPNDPTGDPIMVPGMPARQQRVSDMTSALRQGPRDPTTFEELRVELNQPDATDGEISQAAQDAGLIVEDG